MTVIHIYENIKIDLSEESYWFEVTLLVSYWVVWLFIFWNILKFCLFCIYILKHRVDTVYVMLFIILYPCIATIIATLMNSQLRLLFEWGTYKIKCIMMYSITITINSKHFSNGSRWLNFIILHYLRWGLRHSCFQTFTTDEEPSHEAALDNTS